MSSEFRETRLDIDLGEEKVDFVTMMASEAMSQPFVCNLHVASPYGELELAPHLGKPVGLTIYEDDDVARYFNGTLTQAEYVRESADGFIYTLTLNSFLYFLDSRINFSIFQDLNVIDIIKNTFSTAGITDFEFRTSETYETYEYCVQYGESDFKFISRLMEQEGLYYFFEHHADKHVMVIIDRSSNHENGKNGELAFNPTAEVSQSYRVASDWGDKHYLKRWSENVSSAGDQTVTLADFDFKKPTKPIIGTKSEQSSHDNDKEEHYLYPGIFNSKMRADHLSQIRIEELRANRQFFEAETTSKGICVGTRITVSNHPNDRYNDEYLVISSTHMLQTQSYRSGTGANDADTTLFVAIPFKVQFRAARKTKKPKVIGLESAIVTGPKSETIYTDEYGRVKVRFHWDRSGSNGEHSTCWIRVSQTGGLGNIILPRIGHEVLVSFLNGDPDRPVITGRVFNAENMPVYGLPENKTVALWRTKTYGEEGNYPETEKLDTQVALANEIRFEDKGGSEEVFVHAQRDMNTRVRFDSSQHVGHDQDLKVGHDRQRYVKNDEKVSIDGNKTYILEKNESNTIKSGNRKTTLKKGSDSLSIKSGNMDIKVDKGKISIEAMQSIELKVGQTVLKLTPVEATLDSTMIKIKGKAMTNVEAGGILTEKGALIKIN